MKRVLVIEPETTVASAIARACQQANYQAVVAANPAAAIAAADEKPPDAVISEMRLSHNSGSEFLYEFRTYPEFKNTPVIFFSSLRLPTAVQNSRDWARLSIHAYLYKPTSGLKQLMDELDKALA